MSYKPFNNWNQIKLIQEILKKEPDPRKYINSFFSVVDPVLGLIKYFGKETDIYGDEPKYIAYRAEITPTRGLSDGGYKTIKAEGGRSLDSEKAIVSAILEGLERYSLSIYKEENLMWDCYNNLTLIGHQVLDPCSLVSYEKNSSKHDMEILRNKEMHWTKCWSIKSEKEILIPAQLVYLPYKFSKSEPVLRDPSTTGAAARPTSGGSILRGLLEVIERDATTINHYRKLPCKELILDKYDEEINSLLNNLKQYGLICKLYDYSLDLQVPVVVCKILDKTGIGPTCTVGAKASFNLYDAAKGAILEAGCLRVGIRGIMDEARLRALPLMNDYTKLYTANDRSFLWSQPEMESKLNYQDQEEIYSNRYKDWDGITEEKVSKLIQEVLYRGNDIIIKDVTTSDVNSLGVKVTKVIIPGLQPMHLHEKDKCFTKRILEYGNNNDSLFNIQDLNQIPHPFG